MRPLRVRTRAGLAGLAGLVAAGLAFSNAPSVPVTEASWTDSENAQADVSASWATGGFAKVTHDAWKLRGDRPSGQSNDWPRVPNPATPTYSLTSGGAASGPGDNMRSANAFGNGYTTDSSIVQPRSTDWDVWAGQYTNNNISGYRFCMSYPQWSSGLASTTNCSSSGTSARINANDFVDQVALSIESSTSKIGRIQVGNVSTNVSCGEIGTTPTAYVAYDTSSSRFEAAKENGTGGTQTSGNTALPYDFSDSTSDRYDGFSSWFRFNVNGTSDSSYVFAIQSRKNTFVSNSPNYALAEVDMTIQIYTAGSGGANNGTYLDTLDFVISRSECGLAGPGESVPPAAGVYRGETRQAGWPSGRPLGDTTVATGNTGPISNGPGPMSPAALRVMAAPFTSMTGPTPTTVTSTAAAASPTGTTTAQQTTTSAPPSAAGPETVTVTSGEPPLTTTATDTPAQTVTVTSEAPATTPESSAAETPTSTPPPSTTSGVPVATGTTATATTTGIAPIVPPRLGTSEQLSACGDVTVDGARTQAVVRGGTCPVSAPAGVHALDEWINHQSQTDYDWILYTSSDPAADGWRWAAVDQVSGTVLYVR